MRFPTKDKINMKTKTNKPTKPTTTTLRQAQGSTPAPAPLNAFNPDFLNYLHGHADIVLFDWLKVNAPPAVLTLHRNLFSLREGEQQIRETGSVDPIHFDIRKVVLETLEAMCEVGAEFSDGYTSMTIEPAGRNIGKDGAK